MASVGFALFLTGAGVTMATAGLFNLLALAFAAGINRVSMLAICVMTGVALELGATSVEGGPASRLRVAQRALQLASIFWAAAGLAFLLSPVLARF